MQENPIEIQIENLNTEDKIYSVAVDRNSLDWKSFLYDLIHREGLNPWDIDLAILTKKYLNALNELKSIDFDISGKFLTVAVFLLKTKSDKFVTSDIRGFDQEVEYLQNQDNIDDFEALDDIDDMMEQIQEDPKARQEKYQLKFRNPIARKRKVNIFDLIKTLEKTFEASNKRKANFLLRHPEDLKYKGPTYEKKKKDLKEIIEDLFDAISEEFANKSGHISFNNHFLKGTKHKLEALDKFVPLLHLHNQDRIILKQEKHFSEIQIHKSEE